MNTVELKIAPWTMFIFNHKIDCMVNNEWVKKEKVFVFIENLDGIKTFQCIGDKDKINFSHCNKAEKEVLLSILN